MVIKWWSVGGQWASSPPCTLLLVMKTKTESDFWHITNFLVRRPGEENADMIMRLRMLLCCCICDWLRFAGNFDKRWIRLVALTESWLLVVSIINVICIWRYCMPMVALCAHPGLLVLLLLNSAFHRLVADNVIGTYLVGLSTCSLSGISHFFWHRMWQDCGRPRSGVVFDCMRRSRLAYHYATRKRVNC